jgi:hypothetical protein
MKETLVVLGGLIAAGGTVPYIIATLKGYTKPRIVTWLTWSLLTAVAGAASIAAHENSSAVFAFLGTLVTSLVVIAGLRSGDRTFTALDLGCLAGVFAGLALWLFLNNPAFGVLAAVVIDFIGLVPTLAHAWKAPHEETLSAFVCVGIGGLITSASIIVAGSVSLIALGYPLYAAVSMGGCAAIIILRRSKTNFTDSANALDAV